jgi:hypothetical protein
MFLFHRTINFYAMLAPRLFLCIFHRTTNFYAMLASRSFLCILTIDSTNRIIITWYFSNFKLAIMYMHPICHHVTRLNFKFMNFKPLYASWLVTMQYFFKHFVCILPRMPGRAARCVSGRTAMEGGTAAVRGAGERRTRAACRAARCVSGRTALGGETAGRAS